MQIGEADEAHRATLAGSLNPGRGSRRAPGRASAAALPGASRRALSEFHGVVVGSAITWAPAAASALAVAGQSSTSNATRMCPATRRPTSTSSMIRGVHGIGQLECGPAGFQDDDARRRLTRTLLAGAIRAPRGRSGAPRRSRARSRRRRNSRTRDSPSPLMPTGTHTPSPQAESARRLRLLGRAPRPRRSRARRGSPRRRRAARARSRRPPRRRRRRLRPPALGESAEQREQTLFAEHAAAVTALGHAVGPERHEVAEPEPAFAILVVALLKHAEQRPAHADLLDGARLRAHDGRRRVACAGHGERVPLLVWRSAASAAVQNCSGALWARSCR